MSEASVTVAQLEIMRHALGHLQFERNYFSTGRSCGNWEAIQGLVASGFMWAGDENPIAAGDTTFYVTVAGCRAAFDIEGLSTKQKKAFRKLFPPNRALRIPKGA